MKYKLQFLKIIKVIIQVPKFKWLNLKYAFRGAQNKKNFL